MTCRTTVIQNAPCKENNRAWHALRFAGTAVAMRVKDGDQVMVFQPGQ